jgi:translation initiation factor IF-1
MIQTLFQKLLNKAGKSYTIDSEIPSGLFIKNLIKRLVMLLRGYFFLYQKVFLGKNCNISHKPNILFRKNVTIENDVTIDGYAKNKLIFGDNVKIEVSPYDLTKGRVTYRL